MGVSRDERLDDLGSRSGGHRSGFRFHENGKTFDGAADPSLMSDPIEKHLWRTIQSTVADASLHIASTRTDGNEKPMMSDRLLRKLALTDMDAAALIHRAAFDDALPALADLQTPAEDRWFFRERVFATCELWGLFDRAELTGMIAFREGWVDHLYVRPYAQGRGVGTQPLLFVMAGPLVPAIQCVREDALSAG
jgi:hypothetical protein